ncbi:hypothetical protein BWP39_27695 [Paraburkholderia acidicola]|uniref:Uncharacterized protein n=1 Tax=Paraburkholderia acidicola TaxID=1912599 RepID=A0A2A4ETH7_9BURK|nr:hypothetical protein BWP39_27695 [Paraburkholderia acidicola]
MTGVTCLLSAARLACALRIALGVSLLELLLGGGASSVVDQFAGAAGAGVAATAAVVCCGSFLAGVEGGTTLVAALTDVLPDALPASSGLQAVNATAAKSASATRVARERASPFIWASLWLKQTGGVRMQSPMH